MKKTVLATCLLSLGLLGGMVTAASDVSAAKWHKGTPSFLTGKKFRTKYMEVPGSKVHYVAISAKKNYFYWISPHNSAKFTKTYYKKNGKIYSLKVIAPRVGSADYKVRYVNKKTVRFQFGSGQEWMYLYRF